MSTTQIKGSQILDGTISSDDIDDSIEKEFTKVRVGTNDSTPDFLSTKLVAGSNITLTVNGLSGSNQTLMIAADGGGGGGSQGPQGFQGNDGHQGPQGYQGSSGPQGNVGTQGAQGVPGTTYFSSITAGMLFTTGSIALIGSEQGTDSTYDKGADVFFYVSGSSDNVSLFGGDVVISGSVHGKNGATFVCDLLQMTGSIEATLGFSGSLTQLTDGTSYLIAGQNITIISSSNGSITISAPYGSQGPQGYQGDAGPQGPQGYQGLQGDTGAQGANGTTGLQGVQGYQGDVGTQGLTGNQGFQGSIGTQGPQGNQGYQGQSGGNTLTVTNHTGTGIITSNTTFAAINSAGGSFVLSLETNPTTGKVIYIKDVGGSTGTNSVTLSGNGKTIDGAANFLFAGNYTSLTLVYNGTEWSIV